MSLTATTHDIVQKLWSLCDVLRDDGITYHQYVSELTYLLFLKMAEETGRESKLPEGYRWKDLSEQDGLDQLTFYKGMLLHLGTESKSKRVKAIFADANSSLTRARNLKTLTDSIDALDWYSAKHEGLGDLYEGLLEKNANEKKSGAGQYFTPRPLIDSMVALTNPQPGEYIQDPAAGTCGFLVAADRHIKANNDNLYSLSEEQIQFQEKKAFYGMEWVRDAQRLALMNLMLHDIEGNLQYGDTLGPKGADLRKADLILTNPPFGSKKGGGGPTRDDFTFPTSNKQLAFLQHIYRGLKPGGRAAVVLPDNVLFEGNVGAKIRADLMDKCNLHTILRLPTGIFYAQGVKTNVLFFERGASDEGNTERIWIFDMRTNMPSFGKRTPLTRDHFSEFESCYSCGERVDQGEGGRFRCFTRDQIAERGENLDISWLRDEDAEHAEDLPEPDEIAEEIIGHLKVAMEEMEALAELLEVTA
jgi:type I restriction enzyme M protein